MIILWTIIPRAVNKVLRKSEADEVIYTWLLHGWNNDSPSLQHLHPELPIKNIVFMTSPFDFEDTGLYGAILDEKYFDVDKVVDTLGLIPPEMIDFGNKMIKPMSNFYGPYVSLVDRAENDRFRKELEITTKMVK